MNCNHYLIKYGGIKKISNELNLSYKCALRYNKDDIKDDFNNVYLEYGYINIELYLQHGKYSKQAIKTEFGSVNNLMKELNIPLNTSRMENKETVSKDILFIYNKYNTTSSNIYRKYGKYSECVINRIYGSWKNAIIELGLDVAGKTYGKEEIEYQVKKVYEKYGFISKALIDDECDFTYQAIRPYYKNRDEISKMLGVNNAFCDKLSSKAEVIYIILCDMYDNVIREKTWDWLVNDRTNRHLRVDFYLPDINLAIEFDGKQHYEYTPMYHKTNDKFLQSQYRDQIKNKLLEEHKIKLLRISYKEKISKSYIEEKINKMN